VSDSDLRQALLGTWRLVNLQETVDGTVAKPLGDNPQGYLVYTKDAHVFVQFATRAERKWSGPEVLELPGSLVRNAIGWGGYCGAFEVHDSQLVHHMEFGFLQRQSGRVETRSAVLDGDRLILGTPAGALFEWQRVHPEGQDVRPDSELRQMLLGTWRLTSVLLEDVGGRLVRTMGDNPQGYLVYTPDDHVFVQFATRAERTWPGPEVLEMPRPEARAALGFWAYCGTFEVRDQQIVHGIEFSFFPSMGGSVEARSVTLDGDRLILGSPRGGHIEWERVHTEGEPQ
jgi:hypothetical protein